MTSRVTSSAAAFAGWRGRRMSSVSALAALVVIEIALFAVIGSNFLTAANAREIARASADGGLLALALTPVILTGGIDLSVGSLMGLSAVALGALWRDGGWPIGAAAAACVIVGLLGGALNAVLVAGLGVAPLIVTLGTFSLFRGVAVGLTAGIENYSSFPRSLLFLGQGAVLGIPCQLFVLGSAAAGIWLIVHRMPAGRMFRAIGFSPDGARHAALPVGWRLAMVYLMSGASAGIAALFYVARLGQAKADAGTGIELWAITAVVLGGTSIFGGRGSVGGTLLGVAALAILHNGVTLADLPAELAGILTAGLLLAALGGSNIIGKTRVP